MLISVPLKISARRTWRDRIKSTIRAGYLLARAAEDTAEAASKLTADVRELLCSEDAENAEELRVPDSIRRILSLLRSPEVADTVGNLARGALGLTGGGATLTRALASMLEVGLDAACSDRGRDLISLIVGRAARESVGALVGAVAKHVASAQSGLAGGDLAGDLLSMLERPVLRDTIMEALSTLVSSAVAAYIDKTTSMHIDVADSVISSVMKVPSSPSCSLLFLCVYPACLLASSLGFRIGATVDLVLLSLLSFSPLLPSPSPSLPSPHPLLLASRSPATVTPSST